MNHDGDLHELLDLLAQTPDKIATSISSLSDSELRRKKSADDFSVLENICHLRDLEIEGYAVRIDRILADDEPELADFDGGLIAAQRNYNSQDLDAALRAFGSARHRNVERMRQIAPEIFDRTANLQDIGRITLKDLLSLMR